jgi:tRNA threonylcarbamoyladenosine biosynthesis protein TsaE
VRSLDLVSGSVAQTRRLGRRLGELLRPGDVVLLEGEFGAGKTVLSQGLGRGLGVSDYITSPSFTLINEYTAAAARGGFRVYHIDLYRLDSAAEALDLGLLDYLGGEGVCLVEWAERVRPLLPPAYLLIRLVVAGATRRRLRLEAYGERHGEILARFAAAAAGD